MRRGTCLGHGRGGGERARSACARGVGGDSGRVRRSAHLRQRRGGRGDRCRSTRIRGRRRCPGRVRRCRRVGDVRGGWGRSRLSCGRGDGGRDRVGEPYGRCGRARRSAHLRRRRGTCRCADVRGTRSCRSARRRCGRRYAEIDALEAGGRCTRGRASYERERGWSDLLALRHCPVWSGFRRRSAPPSRSDRGSTLPAPTARP